MAKGHFLLGYDVGSSSVKASLLDAETGATVAAATSPDSELSISAPKPGWAEQEPEEWWKHVVLATRKILVAAPNAASEVAGIGVSYQMHGLVLVDKQQKVLRPSIIWCDSRAVELGAKALRAIGEKTCLSRFLNSPGNFTASKLAWVKENEPAVFAKVFKAMLPGDYVAMRLTGEIRTTVSGLSEGILWDFTAGSLAEPVLKHYGIPREMLAETVPTFSVQGTLMQAAAAELGLSAGVPVSYRAGDQPNNAFSLKVLEPGEAAATAGTSGVVYGVTSEARADARSRVNTFVHVSHDKGKPRYGVLLCLNGTGILNSWIRRNLMGGATVGYDEMNKIAAGAPVGSDGLAVMPFGNGAERILDNANPGAAFVGLDFNRHAIAHVLRAAQEGIVFALCDGISIMKGIGSDVRTVRAGHANMFLSPVFAEAFATTSGAVVELFKTDGSAGAARGAGVGAGVFPDMSSAFKGLSAVRTVEPRKENAAVYQDAFGKWKQALARVVGG